MSGPNAELFVAVLAQIEKHPETWDQTVISNECGTAFCFAGWALNLTGFDWVEYFNSSEGSACATAAQRLGIPAYSRDSGDLFDGLNTKDDLYLTAARILGLDAEVLREKVAAVVADGSVQS